MGSDSPVSPLGSRISKKRGNMADKTVIIQDNLNGHFKDMTKKQKRTFILNIVFTVVLSAGLFFLGYLFGKR